MQDIWVRLAAIDDTRAIANPQGFVTTVANNLIVTRLRARQRHRSISASLHLAMVDEREERSPERVVVARDALAGVMDQLQQLAPRTRSIFVQHRLEHRGTREIALLHGISEEAVLYHVRRATARIRPAAEGLAEARPKT